MLKKTVFRGLLTAAIMSLATAANAELDGPVNYIIPFGPGGESDISARLQQPFF